MSVTVASSTLQKEYKLRVLENRVLLKIFRPKSVEVTGVSLYVLFTTSRKGLGRACSTYGRQQKYRVSPQGLHFIGVVCYKML